MSRNIRDEMENWSASSRMPFGKHKDECLANVPEGYKKWLAEQDWVIEKWSHLLEALKDIKQINKRDMDTMWCSMSSFPIGKNEGNSIESISEFGLKWYIKQKWFRDAWPRLTSFIKEYVGEIEEDGYYSE